MNNHKLAGKHRTISGKPRLARRSLRVLMALALVVPLFAYVAPGTAAAADPVPLGGAVTNNFQTWEPATNSWVPGNATGYSEGDVAAFSAEVTVADTSPSTAYYVTACFEYTDGGKYAFIDLQPYDTSFSPTVRGGAIVASADGASTDWGTINGVTSLTPTEASTKCAPDSIGYTIYLTTGSGVTAPETSFYIYFGNTLAMAGLTTEYGDVVPSGGGVGSWPVGVFQAWLEDVTGNKTVNFKPALIVTPPNPSLTVVKSSTTSSLSAAGTVDYSYLVTNTGNVTLTGISLSDDNDNNDMSCPAATLDPGAYMTCTATHTFTQAELDANGSPTPGSGVLYNLVTASSNEAPDATDDLSIPISVGPSLTVVKSSTTSEVTAAGQIVPYSYLLTNAGNVTLTGVTLSDDNTDADPVCEWANSSDAATGAGTLSIGETVTCSASHTVTQAEMNAGGTVDNTATADSDQTSPVNDNLSIPIAAEPSISVTKSASPTSRQAPGGAFTYTVTAKNTSAVTIYLSGITDDKFGDLTSECQASGYELAPGATFTCTFDRTVNGTAGTTHINVVTVNGYDSHENPVSGSDSATVSFTSVPSSPSIDLSLIKTDVADPVNLGDNIVYQLKVANAGPDTATGVVVTDTLPAYTTFVSASGTQGSCSEAGGIVTCNLGTLGVGSSATITVTVTPTRVGAFTNGATVVGDQTDFNPSNNSDDEQTDVVEVLATTATNPPETLPFTGSSSTGLGGAGIALLLLGGLVLLAFRKQEDPIIETDVASRIDYYRV
jgi:uncharacterized repeat protein (TIGR01451 family)/LPXTG-motif cell wall-anchored protein